MSEPIKVGDLVMVVRNRARSCRCKCSPRGIGMIRRVLAIHQNCSTVCVGCGEEIIDTMAELDGAAPWGHWHIEVWRLKRIDPLPESEPTTTGQEITA